MESKTKFKKLFCLFLVVSLLFLIAGCSSSLNWENQRTNTAKYLLEQIDNGKLPIENSEWALIGIKYSDTKAGSEVFESYYDSIRAKVKSSKGVLSEDFYTEYARVSLGVALVGKDPKNVEGYNLIENLNDFKIVTDQGVNASIYALIASKYCGYSLNEEAKNTYLNDIRNSFKEGGEAISNKAVMDYCGMALQALAYYECGARNTEVDNNDKEQSASKDEVVARETVLKIYNLIEKEIKNKKSGVDLGSCEANAQVILGLSAMGIDLENDKRFIKDGKTLIDGMMEYAEKEGFAHIKGEKVNLLASQQALMALDSFVLAKEGKMLMPERLK